MQILTNRQIKKIKGATLSSKHMLNNMTFKDISNDNMSEHNFRNNEISVNDLNNILLGKAVSVQQDSISTIVSLLKIEGCLKRNYSRSSLNYRINQIDPRAYLNKLIDANTFEASEDYKTCLFDGTSITLPNNEEIKNKYPNPKTATDQETIFPIAKLHYLITLEEHTCVGALIENHNLSERVAMIQLAIEAHERGQKLHIIADRGLYGATVGYVLNKHGHRYSLRYCGTTLKTLKIGKFKRDSITINFNLNRKSIKPYIHVDLDLEKCIYKFRIIRKKGNSKKKAIYIMTNDFESPAKELANQYWNRQRVEDSFKYLKSYGGLEKSHPNTGLQMVELIIASLIFYLSIVEKSLYQLIGTPQPNEHGKLTANRRLAWKIFFLVIKSNYSNNMIREFAESILAKLLEIRPGRSAPRYKLRLKRVQR